MAKKNQVSEPAVAYNALPQSSVMSLFGGANILHLTGSLSSDFEFLNLTRRGIPKKSLLTLAKKISLTIQDIADILHISERTLQRYDDNALIKPEHSEKAIELARLYARGVEVLGTLEAFKSWMNTPNYALHNEVPLSLLDTSIGFDMVLAELGRIEHGIFC